MFIIDNILLDTFLLTNLSFGCRVVVKQLVWLPGCFLVFFAEKTCGGSGCTSNGTKNDEIKGSTPLKTSKKTLKMEVLKIMFLFNWVIFNGM